MIKKLFIKDKSFLEIIKASSYNMMASVIAIILGLVFNLIISKYYGAKELGTYSIINTIMSISIIFALLGTNTAILRLVPEHIVKHSLNSAINILKQMFLIVSLLSILISLIIYISASPINQFFFSNSIDIDLFKYISYFLIFNALGILSLATIRAFKSILYYAVMQIIAPLSNIIFLVIFTIFFYQENNSIYALFISYIVVLIFSFTFIFTYHIKHNDKTSYMHKEKMFNIMKISTPMFLTTMMSVIIMQIDILMLTSLSTLENVGIYTIVAKVAVLSLFVSSTINTISGPKFSELYHSNKFEELKNTAKKSTLLQIIVSVPLILLLFATKEYILSYFGAEFVGGVNALTILLLTYLYATFFGPVEMFMNMTGKQKQLNIIITTGAFINIILNYFLIPSYGIEGAAIASLASLVFTKTVSTIYIKKIFTYTLVPNLIPVRV